MYNIKIVVKEFIKASGEAEYMDTGDALDVLHFVLGYFDGLRPATKVEIGEALARYGTDGIQIDSNAMATDCEDETGRWVQAWVYLPEED